MLLAVIVGTAATRPAGADPGAKIAAPLARVLASQSTADYWVVFAAEANLGDAKRVRGWRARGEAVVDALRETADRSQAGVRSRLRAAGVDFDPYFIANAMYIHDGSEALAKELESRPEVERLEAPRTYNVPEPVPSVAAEPSIAAVEWGLDAIGADEVWSTYGVRGEGIVVANIDTGVQFDHPALVRQYRGNSGGTFDHNYNWFDPSGRCGTPSVKPCDDHGHGTATMGLMVGDDGAGNQIGVAPGSKWIAVKGCESSGCSDASLLGAGQWLLAPTDLSGSNPRPDLRPNIVNSSWGGSGDDFWYKATVEAWRAAGIFPAFSIGNSGPSCNTDGSPGDYVSSYASGAFDINGNIATDSSRGPGENGNMKPNLAAPGEAVRTSMPVSGYGLWRGTSMASPHTAGTVALMWSAAPVLVGDLALTEDLLDNNAVDVADTTCGGTTDDNNVWGEGKLDAFGAVRAAPRGPVGSLAGRVTDSATGRPVAGAAVRIAGPLPRDLVTGPDGAYASRLPVGDYSVTVTATGYAAGTASVTIVEGQATTHDVALTPLLRAVVLDTFNRANGPLGGNWRGLTQSTYYRIAANRLDVQRGGPIYWNTPFGSTQEAFVTLSTIDSRSVSQGVLLKVGDGDLATAAAITATYDARARGVSVSALRGGARSWTLYPRQPVTFNNGDQLGARVTTAGVVQILRNGSLASSVTLNAADQAYFNGRGGKIGISTLDAPSAFFDDFGGGGTTP